MKKSGRKVALCVAEKPSVAKYVAEKLAGNKMIKVLLFLDSLSLKDIQSTILFMSSIINSKIKTTSLDLLQ